MKILIDADAFPNMLKDIIFRAVNRLEIRCVLVACQHVNIPESKFISFLLVPDGADSADDKIVALTQDNDLVITADIPLADRVIEKGGTALSPRGDLLTEENIKQKLATRNLLYELRTGGLEIGGGPPPFTKKDSSNFANTLNTFLVRMNKRD